MSSKKSTILIVDDNQDIRDLVSLILEEEGFNILSAPEGESALSLIREKSPDLVLLDVMMPGKSGIEVLAEIRKSKNSEVSQTPVLMLTAKSQVTDIDEALEAGASSYIIKPFRADALLEKVNSYLPAGVN